MSDQINKLKAFSCAFCAASFSRYAPLKKHINSVHLNIPKLFAVNGISSTICPFSKCRKKCQNTESMQEHVKSLHTPKVVELLKCPVQGCKRRFRNKTNWEKHIIECKLKNYY